MMNRRHFVLGAAAAGVLGARRAGAASSPARRFVFLLSPNGFDARVLMNAQTLEFARINRGTPIPDGRRWGENSIVSYGAMTGPEVLTDDLTTAPALMNLGPLAAKACVVLGLSSQVTGGGHFSAHGALSSTRTVAGSPGGPTLDAYLSRLDVVRGVGDGRAPVAAMRVGYNPATALEYTVCAATAGRVLPTLNSSELAWSAFLGPLASAEGTAQLNQRASMLRLARTQLAGYPAPTSQAVAQLDAYGAAVADLEHDLDRFRAVVDAARGATLPPRPTSGRRPIDLLRDQCATVSAGLRFGVSNVAVISAGGSLDLRYGPEFAALGDKQSHDERHNYDAQTGDDAITTATKQARRDAFFAVWRAEVDALLSIARDLDATPEPGGTGSMLDHTVLVYTSDNGEGHHSLANEYPALLLGGGALGLRTGGRTVIYPSVGSGSAHRQLSNLWQTLGGPLVSQRLDTFGTEGAARIAAGPLPELYTP